MRTERRACILVSVQPFENVEQTPKEVSENLTAVIVDCAKHFGDVLLRNK